MQLFIKYFLFIAVLVGVVNGIALKPRLINTLKDNSEGREQANRIFKGYTLAMTLLFLLLGIIQLIGGYETPFFIFNKPNNMFVALAWLVLVVSWGLAFTWVFFKDGAKIIIKYNLFSRLKTPSEAIVKVYVLLMLLGGIAALTFGSTMNLSQVFNLK